MSTEPLFFPVRHFSPMAAHLVGQAVRQERFDAVLIEGPSEFNDRIDELLLDHELPLALYSYAILRGGARRGAFYPFCEFSPEWQALKVAAEVGVPVAFIDLPWRHMAAGSHRRHRYSDENFQGNPYILSLCERLEVEGFDELWDVVIELQEFPHWRDYVTRTRALCDRMRQADPVADTEEDGENLCRERFMAEAIRQAQEAHGERVLVVTGGFHCSGIEAYLAGEGLEVPEREGGEEEEAEVLGHGIELTPFTYHRVDSLSGYRAGLQGPAIYEELWRGLQQGEGFRSERVLAQIVQALRDRGQVASTADVVAVEGTAKALARMRGREQVWRYDLLDALSSALVKEAQDAEYAHPMLMVAREVMTGHRRGRIDPRAGVPPLVGDVRRRLEERGCEPGEELRSVRLDLHDREERDVSQLLHQCGELGLRGIRWLEGADLFGSTDVSRVWEEWELRWSPEFDATLIEASAYGTTLPEAAAARLLEWRASADPGTGGANAAGAVILRAALMGLEELRGSLVPDLATAVVRDSDFFSVTTCLRHLIFLDRFHDVFGTDSIEALARAVEEILLQAFERAIWLYQRLGKPESGEWPLLEGIFILFQSVGVAPKARREEQRERLSLASQKVAVDPAKGPVIRGAAWGICLRTGASSKEDLPALFGGFYNAEGVGDFLTGLFRMAREAFLRDLPFLTGLDGFLVGLDEEEFLEALPSLRMAFTFFTPREKLEICDLLFSERVLWGGTPGEFQWFDDRLRTRGERYGLRFPAGDAESGGSDGDDLSPGPVLELTEVRRERWRMVLGDDAESVLGELTGEEQRRDVHLSFLYHREYGQEREVRDRSGGFRSGGLNVPEWINGIHELFPKATIERLERDALERYQIDEVITRPEVLERLEPNMTLLKAVLRCKPLMDRRVLGAAKKLVRKVIEELMKKWAREIESPFQGAPDPRRRSNQKIAKNFHARETIRRNLKHFDPRSGKLVLRKPYFFSRRRRFVDRWQVIVVVDQSGSMLESVIHSAVTASIFAGIQSIRSHLVAFDTRVVDLTDRCGDPVETLMSVQLGGGTDINLALSYAHGLVENPRRAIIVLVTDFFEGGNPVHLLATTRAVVESGVTLLGLAALDQNAEPCYDREIARKMVDLGAHVGAMTPGELAAWIAERVT